MPTKAEEVVATAPPSDPPPPQEMVATKVEAEKQLPAIAPPLQQPHPEGGAAEEASSVHRDEKDATPARAQEGEETKPEKKHAAPAGVQEGRRRWRQLQAAVRLIFLRCKIGDRSTTPQSPLPEDKGGETKQPVSELEEKKPALVDQGEMKPAAPAGSGNQPASGQEQMAAVPPPPETSSQETAADAENPLAAPLAPPTQQPPQKQEGGPPPEQTSSVKEEQKDAAPARAQEGEGNAARRRWRCLWAAVCLLFLRPKPKDKQGKQPVSEKTTPAEKLQENQAGAVAGGAPAAKTTNAMARFQKAGKLVRHLISWYKRHRCSGTEERKGDETKPATAPDGDKAADAGVKLAPADDGKQPASGTEEKKPHPKWAREEGRLEKILEDAFTRLLATEFHQLRPIRKKCLLTFSVFELAAEVKKQVMVYWWVSEFNLRHRIDQSATDAAAAPGETKRRSRLRRRARKPATAAADGGGGNPDAAAPQGNKADGSGGNPDAAAEGIFSELSSHGFLEPARNWCSRVIHGCKVNPLVHWMVKRRARDDRCADLDDNGKPSDLQPKSSILCLTSGNRRMLQKMRIKDESPPPSKNDESSPSDKEGAQKPNTPRTTSASLQSPPARDKAPDQGQKHTQPIIDLEHDDISPSLKGKRVILNINAHVYPVSKSIFFELADYLVVLQLGRWSNLDDDTYMEVGGLESLSEIGPLKNLRYLSLRGLSRLTELPKWIQWLKKLAILDMRGCQNLVNVASNITKPLKQLTHLDLTECYMLEHIGREITSLSELRVFKGFVFATGTQRNKACQVQDLKNLKKLQKLTISIATDANVGKSDMADLKHLTSLHKLTITWGEIPRILDGESKDVKRKSLVEKWTSFDLPQELLKLDLRCYPKKDLKLKAHKNLKKLYLRGGELENFSIDEPNCIKTLRLRYLKNFNMDWEEICSILKDIEYVEIIVPKDEKQLKDVDKDQKDKKDKNITMKNQEDDNIDISDQKDTGEVHKPVENIDMNDQKDKEITLMDPKDMAESKLVKKKMNLFSILDENGVWVKDNMEEENLRRLKAPSAMEKSKGVIDDRSTGDINHDNDIATKNNQKD